MLISLLFAANVYTTPECKSVETQALYGEPLTILEEHPDCYRILANGTDEGWVKKNDVIIADPFYNIVKIDSLKAHIYKTPSTMEEAPSFSVPYGASIESLNETQGKWLKVAYLTREGKNEGWIQKGDIVQTLPALDPDTCITFAERFLERPYTWGGLSSDGLDCSGLVKIVLMRRGHVVPHSAAKQAKGGAFVEKDALKRGDLLFFEYEGKVRHVDLYRGDGTFIHATANESGRPCVRIDRLDDPIWIQLYATARRY